MRCGLRRLGARSRARRQGAHARARPAPCAPQVPVVSGAGAGGNGSGSPGPGGGGDVHVSALALAQSDPSQLLTACSDGLLRLFDVRSSGAAVCTVSAGRGPLAGLVFEPNGRPGSIVVGTASGARRAGRRGVLPAPAPVPVPAPAPAAHQAPAAHRPHSTPTTPTPCHPPTHTTAHRAGELRFMDLRVAGGADASGGGGSGGAQQYSSALVRGAGLAACGPAWRAGCALPAGPPSHPHPPTHPPTLQVRTVEAHARGGMCALVAHPNAPLLATATTGQVRPRPRSKRTPTDALPQRAVPAPRAVHRRRPNRSTAAPTAPPPPPPQVVKVWSDRGEPVGALRPAASLLAPRPSPGACLAFHPYQLLLAVGGRDGGGATVHAIDSGAAAAAAAQGQGQQGQGQGQQV